MMTAVLFYLVGVVGLVGLYALVRAVARKREDTMGPRWQAQHGVRRADYRLNDPEDPSVLQLMRQIARAQQTDDHGDPLTRRRPER